MRPARSTCGLRILATAVACCLGLGAAVAQDGVAHERVTFLSLDGRTTLVASLMRPPGEERSRPALVLLHGCTGLQKDGRILPIYSSWARLFVDLGYVVLLVDSAGPRGFGQTCTESAARRTALADRPKDAYAALKYLLTRPFVRPDRVGVVGWSQGGATILRSIGTHSSGRPQGLAHDFRVGVAFYPGLCSDRLQSRPFVDVEPRSWTTAVPLLVLQGEADNWTPAAPCSAFIAQAKARGAPVEIKLYPGAYHVFDAPNLAPRKLPAYRMRNGAVPLAGTDHAARADVILRVPEFLRRYLQE